MGGLANSAARAHGLGMNVTAACGHREKRSGLVLVEQWLARGPTDQPLRGSYEGEEPPNSCPGEIREPGRGWGALPLSLSSQGPTPRLI